MDFFRASPRQPQSALLQSPPLRSPRRMTTPAGDRLAVIMEDNHNNDDNATAQAKKQNRWSGISSATKKSVPPRISSEPTPPPYARYDFQADGHRIHEEKANGRKPPFSRRGGWLRLAIILAIVALLVIGLAVGLGVGLTRHKRSSSNDDSSSSDSSSSSSTPAVFPLGSYSLTTSLSTVSTNCTSNSATWLCYPYSVYSESSPSSSAATFDWILTNTSTLFAINSSSPLTTSTTGIPANISISSTANPFSISFTNESAIYINNASNPYLTFSFTQSKAVIPSTAITTDGSQATCFYNSTIFSAKLYLSASSGSPNVDYTSSNASSSSNGLTAASSGGGSSGGYTAWPYAVEVSQISPGGRDVPACYEMVNGAVGARIMNGLTAEGSGEECLCDYKNYGLS